MYFCSLNKECQGSTILQWYEKYENILNASTLVYDENRDVFGLDDVILCDAARRSVVWCGVVLRCVVVLCLSCVVLFDLVWWCRVVL